MAIDLLI